MFTDEFKAALAKDETALKAIRATRAMIYIEHRDWHHISKDGRPVFDSEDAAMGYVALSEMLGETDPPDVGDARIGGVSMAAIDALGAAMAGRL